MTKWGLPVYAALALNLLASPQAAQPEREPGGPVVLTVENLSAALYQIGEERDALRLALRGAHEEIARLRGVQTAHEGILAGVESELSSCITAGEALKASNDVLNGLLDQERRAGKRARWLALLRVGIPAFAGGYVTSELTGD